MGDIIVNSTGNLLFNGKQYRCSVGKLGITRNKSEGDLATPEGWFFLRKVYFRGDKLVSPKTELPVSALSIDDGWCDDATRSEYNTKIKLPFEGGYEQLWRSDDIYDVIVVIGYNDTPVVPGKGSAIFLHIARPEYVPTEGCIALTKQDLLEILYHCSENTRIFISANVD